jgi:hypothetical protein
MTTSTFGHPLFICFVLFLLAIVLSVLQITASYYQFAIFIIFLYTGDIETFLISMKNNPLIVFLVM